MHEWALAEGVVSTILSSIDASNKRILSVEIVLGELQQVEVDIFKFALSELSKGTPLEEANFDIRVEEAQFKCRVCGTTWSFKEFLDKLDEEISEAIHFVPEVAHSFMGCPNCKSSDFDVVKGREMYIRRIEVLEE